MTIELNPFDLYEAEQNTGEWYARTPRPGSMVAIVADWCGHCKALKKSVELANQISPFPAYYVDSAKIDRQKLESMGFPTIFVVKYDGSLERYERSRAPQDLAAFFRKAILETRRR